MSHPKPPTPGTLPDRTIEVPRTELPPTPGGPAGPPVPTGVEYPTKSKQRVDFRAEEFDRVIGQHGKHVIWRKAVLCPCHREETGRSRINCLVCGGSGYHYIDPIAIQAHMVQFEKSTKIYEKFGIWMEGKCSITMLPEHRIGFRDSLQMRDSVMSFHELITKGNRKGIRSALPSGTDSARYRIVSVTSLVYLSAGAAQYLENDVDYTITEDGWLKWTAAGSAKVTDGTTLSIRYEFHPVWIVNSFPHALRDDVSGRKSPRGVDRVIALPIQAAAYMDFLLDENLPQDTVAPTTGGL